MDTRNSRSYKTARTQWENAELTGTWVLSTWALGTTLWRWGKLDHDDDDNEDYHVDVAFRDLFLLFHFFVSKFFQTNHVPGVSKSSSTALKSWRIWRRSRRRWATWASPGWTSPTSRRQLSTLNNSSPLWRREGLSQAQKSRLERMATWATVTTPSEIFGRASSTTNSVSSSPYRCDDSFVQIVSTAVTGRGTKRAGASI